MIVRTAEGVSTMHPNKRNFIEGLDLIFERWVAFRMALEMEWGGCDTVHKAERFKAAIIDYFDQEGKNVECEDLEDILLEVMSTEFCTLLEDESEREVAKSIWTLFQESTKGKTTLLDSLKRRAALSPVLLPNRADCTTDDDKVSEDEDNSGMNLD